MISQAEDDENRINIAEGALQAAFETRILMKDPLPAPSTKRSGEEIVTLPVETATKAALYVVVGQGEASKSELARKLNLAFGCRIQISVVEVDQPPVAGAAMATHSSRKAGAVAVKPKNAKRMGSRAGAGSLKGSRR